MSETLIKLDLPQVKLTDADGNETSLECMSNQLNFGAVVDDASASFCKPGGTGEAFVEVAAGTSIDWLEMMLGNVNTYVDCALVGHRELPSPSATNWLWAGKLWVPVLTTVFNSAIAGYTRETVRFDSRGQSWTHDKGAGPIAIPGWR